MITGPMRMPQSIDLSALEKMGKVETNTEQRMDKEKLGVILNALASTHTADSPFAIVGSVGKILCGIEDKGTFGDIDMIGKEPPLAFIDKMKIFKKEGEKYFTNVSADQNCDCTMITFTTNDNKLIKIQYSMDNKTSGRALGKIINEEEGEKLVDLNKAFSIPPPEVTPSVVLHWHPMC